ncbi:hypothetical protein BC936DRAFT_136721 [Jimgerdemannia flammicorona]|uniref:TEX10-like TPR repeats domain-containing protein n=1 Tax=Jimgerdemannia flammicorona TaxID=994334 RepID=A0A433DJE4_9FUNG|nr:hypothetical protein BC936DRAFT_136721 [Jimgerdemannia flammicorona]
MCASFLPYLSPASFSSVPVYSHLSLFGSTGTDEKRKSDIAVGAKGDKEAADEEADKPDVGGRMLEVKGIINTLQPVLLATWLDTAPTVFSASGSVLFTSGLQTVHLVLKVMAVLWRATLSGSAGAVDQTWIDSHLQQLLRHFMIYFPFGSDTFGMRDARVESILQDMSILFCELTSLFLLATTLSSTSDVKSRNAPSEQPTIVPAIVHKAGKRRRKTRSVEDVEGGEGKTPAWVERVVEYVLAVLGWENPAQSVAKKPRLSNPLMTTSTTDFKPEHLAALLPTLWGLLNCLGEEKQEWVFEALLGYFKKSHAHSATKRISLEFIIQIYMIQTDPQYTGLFRIRVFSRFAKLLQAWVLGLPKLLWELKAGSMETSRVILETLCDIAKRQARSVFEDEVFDTLEKSMIPFYYVNVPNKGPLFGPFLSLTEDLQLTALEFLFYMPKISDKMETALRECCENEAMSEKIKQYLGEVMRNSSFGE